LPVTLLDFRASEQENTIMIQWSVAAETNFDHYELQRSLNPKNGFAFIANISPRTIPTGSYQYVDSAAAPGVDYYYRLKMIDVDGSVAYSKIRNARVDVDYMLTVFPNPANKEIQLNADKEIQSVSIINVGGQVVKSKTFESGKRQSIDLTGVPKGMYMLKIADVNGNVLNKKLAIE